jgi:hypothetical protein
MATLRLSNTSNGYAAFKVKTTAPKLYLVKPSAGTLAPGGNVEVVITHQPQKDEGASGTHRFLVQAVAAVSDATVSKEEWGSFSKDVIQDVKLGVVLDDEQREPLPSTKEEASRAVGPPEGSEELKDMYKDALNKAEQIERKKQELEEQLQQVRRSAQRGPASSDRGGFGPVHLLLAAVTGAMLAYALTMM